MKNIGQFLAQHIRTIYSVSPQSTVRQALELMADKNIGALPYFEHPQAFGKEMLAFMDSSAAM
jgi:predicted transcriptional regulator